MKIDLVNVSKAYGQGDAQFWALKDATVSATEGDFISIVGPSGSGKSTMLHIFGCLDKPTEGEVRVDDQPIATFSDRQMSNIRRDHIGFVFQQYFLNASDDAAECAAAYATGRGEGRQEEGSQCAGDSGIGNQASIVSFSAIRRRAATCGHCPCIGKFTKHCIGRRANRLTRYKDRKERAGHADGAQQREESRRCRCHARRSSRGEGQVHDSRSGWEDLMTKTIWIIGAVVVVAIGIAAGVIFAGKNDPQAIAATSTKGTGIDAIEATAAVAQQASTPEPVQAVVQETVQVESDSASDAGAIVIETLDELFANASAYSNKEVVVRGTIVTQCISGCTFSLEDGTAVIAVELIDDALDNVLDRGSIGRSVEVRGTVETSPQLAIVIENPDDWNYLD